MDTLNQTLQAQDVWMHQVLESLPIGVLVYNPQGQLIYSNRAAQDLLGPSLALTNQIYRAGTEQFYPADQLPMLRVLQGETVQLSDLELRVQGRAIALEAQTVPLWNSERELLGGAVLLQERNLPAVGVDDARHQAMLHAIPDLMIRVHRDGSCREFILPKTARVEEFVPIHQHLTELLPPDVFARQLQVIDRVLTTGELEVYEHQVQKYGCLAYEEVRIVPINQDEVLILVRDISDRKRSELEGKQTAAALQQSEAYLRTVMNNAPVILWAVDREGVFTLSEGKGLEKLGLRSGESVGLSLFELYAHLPEVTAALRRTLTTGEPYHVVAEAQGRVLEGLANAFYDDQGTLLGAIGVSTDITERQQAEHLLEDYNAILEQQVYDRTLALQQEIAERQRVEASLRQQQELLRRVIDSNPNYIFVKDRLGRYLLANKALADFYHTTAENLLHKTDLDFQLPLETVQQFLQENQLVIDTGQGVFIPEEKCTLPGGREEWLQWQKIPLCLPGSDTVNVLGIGFNITARKRIEEEMNRAKTAAEAASKAKSKFLANMSHELRTPLNAILGFSQLLRQDSALSPEHRENLNLIHRSGEHLLSLINQVLDLSKIEAGRMMVNRSQVDLLSLLQEIVAMFSLGAREKGLALTLELGADLPQMVCTDEMKLRQVLINLVSNAMKFTTCGEIRLRVKSALSEDPGPACLLSFAVADTGVGISQAELALLFEAFVQTTSGQQRMEGTGLGLVISRQFIQLLGGDITVQSQPGQGTTFQFTIPVESVVCPLQVTAPPILVLDAESPGSGLTAQDLESLTSDWRVTFHRAVIEGDLEVMWALLEQVPTDLNALKQALSSLVNQYQFETLLSLMESGAAV